MRLIRFAVLPALLAGAACSNSAVSPVSPTAAPRAAEDTAPAVPQLKASAPAPIAPADASLVASRQPTLVVSPSVATYPDAPGSQPSHRFRLLASDGRILFDVLVNGSSWTVPQALAFEQTFQWQVRAELGSGATAWSRLASFRTPEEPPTILGRGPYPSDGPSVARWVAERWPQYLVGGISEDQRFKNMEFLRDRMIEAGRCGGMDLAWNLKRGVGPHSHDALAWRDGGRIRVVDLALASKDPRFPMKLHWIIVGGEPGYDRYTNEFRCKP